ncbi:uncharacterized protein LOC120438233 isoform X1 [Oreochromis aureus]|uniref:uncharacterized protein LOC120438233 isoform X1 n=1 Tax=Oreochromis aureus TaxID=47969 RepID=UPI0019538F49|nr:uncharacterized protein LOC120438233 isoform X1 [Oreochromis aureus]
MYSGAELTWKMKELVLLYHHGRLVPDYQHPSFENRVDLKDRQIIDGDVSLILKDVTTADSGTYRCRVIQRGRQHMKLISIIYLRVGPPKGRGVDPVFFNTADSAAEVPDSQQDTLTGTDHKIITAVSGQDVTLTCRAQAHIVIVVEWSRTDLEDEELVLLYQHGRLVPDYQHPSFENRVDLKDRQIADGDVSLILKNVRQDDAGTYECRVIKRAGKPLKLISIINLRVGSPTGRGSFNTVDGAAEIPDSKQDTLPGPVNNTSPPATDPCLCVALCTWPVPPQSLSSQFLPSFLSHNVVILVFACDWPDENEDDIKSLSARRNQMAGSGGICWNKCSRSFFCSYCC